VELADYGIDVTFKTNLDTALAKLVNYPDDQEFLGAEMNLREIKDADGEKLRVGIRNMMTKVENVFKPGKGNWFRFDTRDLSKLIDNELADCGFRVVRMANVFLTELTPKGVTAASIAELENKAKEFKKSLNKFDDAMRERISAAHHRVDLANDLYDLIVEMFNDGKDYWSTRDISKYKNYVIYDTPNGTPELSGKTGTANGRLLDKVTMQPIAGSMVSIEFIDNPVVVAADGKWQCANVPIECNTVFGMAPGHKLLKKTIKINEDENTQLDILMETGGSV
jgi:hypothetical protein